MLGNNGWEVGIRTPISGSREMLCVEAPYMLDINSQVQPPTRKGFRESSKPVVLVHYKIEFRCLKPFHVPTFIPQFTDEVIVYNSTQERHTQWTPISLAVANVLGFCHEVSKVLNHA